MRIAAAAALGLLLLLAPSVADAQARPGTQAQGQQQAATQQEQRPSAEEIQLVYEREVFRYAAQGRRDPFRPLTDDEELGPRFDQLGLQGILYSTGQGGSVAVLVDPTGRVYRVREGDVIGNARVVEIGQLRVVMAVETFGTVRQEMLELQRRGGAQR